MNDYVLAAIILLLAFVGLCTFLLAAWIVLGSIIQGALDRLRQAGS